MPMPPGLYPIHPSMHPWEDKDKKAGLSKRRGWVSRDNQHALGPTVGNAQKNQKRREKEGVDNLGVRRKRTSIDRDA